MTYVRYIPVKTVGQVPVKVISMQGWIQPVSLGGGGDFINVLQSSLITSWLLYATWSIAYFTTLLWQNNEGPYGLILRMVLSELYKIMVKNVTFVSFRGSDRPNRPPLDPPLYRWQLSDIWMPYKHWYCDICSQCFYEWAC